MSEFPRCPTMTSMFVTSSSIHKWLWPGLYKLKKQTEFLTDQFQKGEYSGRKSDPQEVLKTMNLVRDKAGGRRFQPDEVLTSQQISGFFSRLSAKKRLEVTAAGNEAKASEVSEVDMESVDEDEISAEAESHLSSVSANEMRDVAIQHPIVSRG